MTAVAPPPETLNASTLTVAKADLARALRAAATVRAKELRLDLYGARATVTAAVREVAVTVDLPGEQTGEPGTVIVPRATLARLLPYLGPEIEVEIDGPGVLEVSDGTSWFAIPTVPSDGVDGGVDDCYRHDLGAIGTAPVTFDAPVLVEALRRAIQFASKDPSRPILEMVALFPTAGLAVATDSYRLAVVRYGTDESNGNDERPVLVHRAAARSMQALLKKRLGEVTIARTESHLISSFDDVRWSILLPKPGATYPNWRSLLPEERDRTCTVKVDREELLHAARAAVVMAAKHEPLRLRIADGKATIVVAGDKGATKATRTLTTARVTGEDMEIGINPDFLADAAAHAPEDRLRLGLIGPLRPITVEAGTDTHLLMPIRLNV